MREAPLFDRQLHFISKSQSSPTKNIGLSLSPGVRMASEKTKSELRHSARKARQLLNADDRDLASQEMCERASDNSIFRDAKLIGCYLASDEEVNCHPLIKCAWLMKKRVFVPTLRKNFKMKFVEFNSDSETRRNKYGLLEPVSGVKIEPENLDVVFRYHY